MKPETRECSDCGAVHPLDADHFFRSGRRDQSGFQYYCKWCSTKRKRAWRKTNRDRDNQTRKLLRVGLSVREERRNAA